MMRLRRCGRRAVLVASLALCITDCGATNPPDAPLKTPLKLQTPIAAIEQDLDGFVPEQLQLSGVPGLSIAIVRGGEVVWSKGFGVASTLTRAPVTAGTLFEVASLSKVVTAYTALCLVAQGKLALDGPLSRHLALPSAAPASPAERITLRQVLTHTSGMSNLLVGLHVDRRVWFPPGDHFSYSGQGFQYLQTVIESVTGEPFEAFVESSVLGDLGIRRSGYALTDARAARHALPHYSGMFLLSSFAGVYALLLPIAFGFVWIAARRRRMSSAERCVRASLLVSLFAAVVTLAGMAFFPRFSASGNLAAIGLGVFAVAVTAFIRIERSVEGRPQASGRKRFLALLVVSALASVAWFARRPAIPLPLREVDLAAAGGLRATAPDVARVLIEIMHPRHLDPALVAEMISAQVRVSERISWGLGIGIQHGDDGDAIWHWGMNPGFESLMVAYPAAGIGVVILTNGGPLGAGLGVARRVAHRAIGGEHYAYWEDVPGTFLPVRRKKPSTKKCGIQSTDTEPTKGDTTPEFAMTRLALCSEICALDGGPGSLFAAGHAIIN